MSADNCLRLLFAVEYLLLENLADFVTSFIEENLQDVLKSEEFSRLELEQLWKLVPAIARGCCLDKVPSITPGSLHYIRISPISFRS